MTAVRKIDSNIVGLSYAEEASLGTLPGSPVWNSLDPNSFADFGGQIKTVARRPISPSRQRKKGTTVDLDASGGFGIDLTQANIQSLLQGFFFATFRTKTELAVLNVKQAGGEEDYEPAAGGGGFKAGDLLFAKGFALAANNGLKKVVSGAAASVVVTTALAPEVVAAPGGTISRVGHEFAAAGDARIVNAGGATLPKLTSEVAGKDLTELGLIVGDWVRIGGDVAANQFATAANNCFARVRTIAAHQIEFDKTENTMVTDAGAGKNIQIFVGRVLKNETGSSIVRRTYQLERLLGAPDDAAPAQIQSEYIIGAVPNEMTINVPSADKVTVDMSFIGTDVEQRTGATGKKAGDRPALVEGNCFNTSSDMYRARMTQVGTATPLFAYFTDLKITLKNNASPLKAVGVLGAMEVTVGTFDIGGSLTAYFSDIAAVAAIRGNYNVSLDLILSKENSGIIFDIPFLGLGDGRPKVELDKPIELPLTMEAGTGASIATGMDHTALMVFFDYLPTAAC